MHIASQHQSAFPFRKLADWPTWSALLPRALAALGHQVSVYVPRYRQTKLTDPQTVVASVTIPFDDKYRVSVRW